MASITRAQLDDVPCIVAALSQSKASHFFTEGDVTSFPTEVLDDLKACVSNPPEPSSIVRMQQRDIPLRHIEIMMRRRRRLQTRVADAVP
jgi:hypothetical protein